MSLILLTVVLAAVALPHSLDLERASPLTAAAICGAALALRALTAVFLAVCAILYIPTTRVFSAISHWCVQAMIPLITAHVPVSGHAIGAAAVIAPSVAVAGSVMSMIVGLFTTARGIRHLLRGATASGPAGSVVLSSTEVMVAAAGFVRPRVVVTSAALVAFDDEELRASLDHELGHIAHNHRYVFLAVGFCLATARALPGSRRVAAELGYHLERDADEYALTRSHDPAALASAICKAAPGGAAPSPWLALSGGPVSRRITRLINGAPAVSPHRHLGMRLCATTLALLVLSTSALLPAAVANGLTVPASAGTDSPPCAQS